MAKPKAKEELIEFEDDDQLEEIEEDQLEEIEEDDLEDYSSDNHTVELKQKPPMEAILDFRTRCDKYELELRGYTYNTISKKWEQVMDPAGRTKFIKEVMYLLTSIVDDTNCITYKSEKEIEEIRRETTEQFIQLCADEDDEQLKTEKISLYKEGFYNVINLYLGLVEKGHGALTIKDIQAGIVTTVEQYGLKNKPGLVENLKKSLGIGESK